MSILAAMTAQTTHIHKTGKLLSFRSVTEQLVATGKLGSKILAHLTMSTEYECMLNAR